MKELWTTNPFHLVNSPFAEMGYNSSEPNIVPAHLLLATRRPSARHPLASGAASVGSLHAICPPAHRAMPVDLATNHLPTHGAASAVSPRTTRLLPVRHPPAPRGQSAGTSRSPCTPAHKPPARTNALTPCKNTFCAIVNCPLQIKPVFYFLFTSTAPPAHRIRVKSSLLRLGRSCLALPFTHLGKDIT